MTVSYDPDQSMLWTLFNWHGTMVPLVLQRPVFWLLMIFHGALLPFAHLTYLNPDCTEATGVTAECSVLPLLEWNAAATLTTLLTFFMVPTQRLQLWTCPMTFYSSDCYGRLKMFFGHCVGLGGAMMNWVALVRVHFPADPDRRWNATRMLLAAMHIQYYTINAKFGRQSDLHTSKATAQEEPISDDEWQLMRERHLLTREESDVVRVFRGYRPFLPLVWALEEVESAFASPSGSVTPSEGAHGSTELRRAEVISSFRAVAFEFRGHCGQITNWLKQPVPFPYFHVLTILMLLNLLLLSYALVTYFFSWYLTLGIYFIIVLVFLGLREVAICMSDPFGDDPIDFDLEPMLLSSYHNAVATLADARAPAGAARNGLENPLISAPNLTPLLAPVAPPPGSVRLVVNDDGSLRQPLTR